MGLVDDALIFGTETYGYFGVPVEGLTTRRGRPKRKLAIDPKTATVVRFNFKCYAADGLSIEEIARRLTSMPEHPLPAKATVGWTYTIVRRILGNERYHGLCSYGKTKAQYLRRQDDTRQQARETSPYTTHLPSTEHGGLRRAVHELPGLRDGFSLSRGASAPGERV